MISRPCCEVHGFIRILCYLWNLNLPISSRKGMST